MRAEVKAAARVVVGCAVAGALGGVVWGLLAPAEHLLVVTENRGAALTGESAHQFDAIAIFVCIAAFLGLISAVASWQWRSMRGPLLFLGLLIGSAIGASIMAGVGEGVAKLRFPHVDSPVVDTVIAIAPGIGTLLTLIVQPLVASFVILVIASVNPLDDLGTGRPRHAPDEADGTRADGEAAIT
ncbi:DUF2567 domain-containing protein [Antrihabitans cavernicola]|uniref:DUF2567 domain-containing protein n=1 Tax=Antrihabitans cavernicola TaxID=2495913 RepID=A0A5A7S7B5_9NOCA|nr:DUF2567 domain-containing protein [Spelaeibacter cavernicola]KAA0021032.1 DUF2567 domain-containing protein [Spelaeibacter cavernicola]